MNQINPHPRTVELELPREINAETASDIQKESVYVSPNLERITITEDLRTAVLTLRSDDNRDDVIDKAGRFLAAMCKHIAGFDVKTIMVSCRADEGPYETDVHAKLVERGWVHDYGKGQVAYSGPALRLAQMVSDEASALYHNEFRFDDAHFPAFVDHDTLHKCGYIDSHPTAVSFVANVVEDFDALEAYRQANSCAEASVMPPLEHLHHGGMCLNPAACLPAYPMLAGRTIGAEGHTVSWLGRVFRYESRNVSGLDRLYEFNVREIVFVGTEEFVAKQREIALPLVNELAETFDLDMAIQSATDPFFATVSAAKKFFQKAQDVKAEVMINVLDADGSPKQIAGGSINLHGPFFGERFDIRTEDGEFVHTGCIGLGIERWVLAAFTQHGFEPARWPAGIRRRVFG